MWGARNENSARDKKPKRREQGTAPYLWCVRSPNSPQLTRAELRVPRDTDTSNCQHCPAPGHLPWGIPAAGGLAARLKGRKAGRGLLKAGCGITVDIAALQPHPTTNLLLQDGSNPTPGNRGPVEMQHLLCHCRISLLFTHGHGNSSRDTL